MRSVSIGLVGTYPPTRCGIASFTESLAIALGRAPATSCHVVRIVDHDVAIDDARFGRSSTVVAHLRNGNQQSIAAAARLLDRESDAVIIQHEYGIYGGPDGDEVLDLVRNLHVPTITVLHTVLEDPTASQRRVLEELCAASTMVVVMSTYAREVLLAEFEVDPRVVRRVPHGTFVAAPGSEDSLVAPDGARQRTMLTWGLIGPGKGIEWGIMALALVRDALPDLRYVVVGETHPKVVAHEGESYRGMLSRLIEALELGDRVQLVDRYLDRDVLGAMVADSDFVLLPYDSRDQVTSGVLAEALAAGKSIVSTPFPHAVELVDDTTGILVNHQDPRAIADAITRLLGDEQHRTREVDAARYAELPSWDDVGRLYRSLVQSAFASRSA